jgi:hypothetical protein
MKSITNFFFILLSQLFIITSLYAYDGCLNTVGKLVKTTQYRSVTVTVNTSCAYTIPDLTSGWKPSQNLSTGAKWSKVGNIYQVPAAGAIGTSIPCSTPQVISIRQDFRRKIGTGTFAYFEYCTMSANDTVIIIDRLPPTALPVEITTSNPTFTAAALRSFFTSISITDNCTPFATLQNNIELPPPGAARPELVTLMCDSENRYTTSYRTKDVCGNYSPWTSLVVRFIDIAPPSPPALSSIEFLNMSPSSTSILLTQAMFAASSSDNWTPTHLMRYSYRVISPMERVNNIPSTGLYLNFFDCTGTIKVRVCAQDCFGNGNLHESDNDVTDNCTTRNLTVRDMNPPYIDSFIECGQERILVARCTVPMPNISSDLVVNENCGYTVYQMPAPGSILNDGLAEMYGPSLWSGVSPPPLPSVFTSMTLPDPIVDCNNINGEFKVYPVSIVIVDRAGNFSLYNSCKTVRLTTSFDPVDGLQATSKKSQVTTMSTAIQNYPNPFSETTTISIKSDVFEESTLKFYNSIGQQIHTKAISLHKGINNLQVSKNEIGQKGIIYYQLINKQGHPRSNINSINKMIIF